MESAARRVGPGMSLVRFLSYPAVQYVLQLRIQLYGLYLHGDVHASSERERCRVFVVHVFTHAHRAK